MPDKSGWLVSEAMAASTKPTTPQRGRTRQRSSRLVSTTDDPPNGVPSLARRNAARAALVAASTTLEYALMLVAMTFNVGLYAAVVGGFALGTLLFGHWGRDSRVKERGATGGPMEQLVAANDEDCCAR